MATYGLINSNARLNSITFISAIWNG